MTVVAGLYDQPFGDWYEAQSPMWVNRFVTAPLPFGVEPVVPPGELGLQLRGGMQFGELGQDVDYTIWGGNGPNFTSDVLGAAMSSPTSSANSQTNGKSIGARFRIYPLPVDSGWGRLELGASTYNGKWSQGNWFNSWGVDFNYFKGSLQARGEWLESYRQMPNGLSTDHRQGWYLQVGYLLNGLNVPGFPDKLNDYVHRLQPLVRYSGVNQRGVSTADIRRYYRHRARRDRRSGWFPISVSAVRRHCSHRTHAKWLWHSTIGSRRRSFGRTNSTSNYRSREDYLLTQTVSSTPQAQFRTITRS